MSYSVSTLDEEWRQQPGNGTLAGNGTSSAFKHHSASAHDKENLFLVWIGLSLTFFVVVFFSAWVFWAISSKERRRTKSLDTEDHGGVCK
jgi:hypothetical protein